MCIVRAGPVRRSFCTVFSLFLFIFSICFSFFYKIVFIQKKLFLESKKKKKRKYLKTFFDFLRSSRCRFVISLSLFGSASESLHTPVPLAALQFMWICLFPLCCRSVNTIWQQSERDWFIMNTTHSHCDIVELGFQYLGLIIKRFFFTTI